MTFIQRKTFFQLKNHLKKPEISLILGPRQAGKTTIIKKLQEKLEKSNKSTFFLNLDVIENGQFFKSQHALIDFIEKKVGKNKAFVFIDEVSRLKNAGLFLKGLYDLKTNYKFIVTGSGSLELKANIIEPLTGRKKIFYCFPLSFTEFAAYKLKAHFANFDKLYEETTKELVTQPYKRQRWINEYLSFGGYPRVALAETEEEKIEVLREIYSSYLEKDIALLLKVEKEQAFKNLVKILAHQVGNIINRAELSSTLGIAEKTVKKYLHLLEKTFVISLVKPFFQNARKELTKSPKVYFSDLGLLHIAQEVFPSIEKSTKGNVFENACFLRLKELGLFKLPQFWRTKSGAEVDFIISSPETGKPIPIEVKLAPKDTFGKSLISFIKKYQPKETFIYSLKKKGHTKKYRSTKVHFFPYHFIPRATGIAFGDARLTKPIALKSK